MTRSAIFDDQELESFTSSVDRFVVDRYPFERQRALAKSVEGFGRGEWGEMAQLGWMALAIPAELGGFGGGAREEAIIMAAVGRGLLLEPFLATVVLSASLVVALASDSEKRDLLSAISCGDHVLACGLEHGAAVAIRDGDAWRIEGSQALILHGDVADGVLLAARVGESDEIGLFLVDPAVAGVSRTPFRFVDGRRGADLVFHAAAAVRLGDGDARAAVAHARDRGTIAVCAEALGAMAATNELTLAYAKTRQQFGVTIGSFQALQHRLVDMSVAEVEARSIVAAAAEAFDAGHPMAPMLVSAAKVKINRAARLIGEGAIQLHGGIGMTEELAVGHYFKRLLSIGALFGDCDYHLDRLADAA